MSKIIVSAVLADVLKKYGIESKRLQEVFEEAKKKGYVSLADVPLILRRELLKEVEESQKVQALQDIMKELKREGLLSRGVLVSSDEGAGELRFASEDEALQHLADVTGQRVMVALEFEVAEKDALKDPKHAYHYARHTIEAPFPEGEDLIAQDPTYAFSYAKFVLNDRFFKGEKTILKDQDWVASYAVDVIKGCWPEAEELISKSSSFSFSYAKEVIKGPWSKGEDAIAKDTTISFRYAKEIIKGPWSKGEDAIAKNAVISFRYATEVLKKRFEKGEPRILKNKQYRRRYLDFLQTYDPRSYVRIKES